MRMWQTRRKTETDPKAIESFHRYASVFLLALITGLSAYLAWRLPLPRKDFHNNLWAPVHLLARGQSPYHTSSLRPDLPALWFPMAVGFFSPLGLLSEAVATKAWFVLNIVELFVILLLSLQSRFKFYTAAIIAILVFLFPPTLNHIVLGQFSLTAMFCLLISTFLAAKRRDWLAALFLALGLAKPQLGILAVPGLLQFYLQHGGLKSGFRFGVQTFLMALLMSLPLFIIYPAWMPDWLASLNSNLTWLHPSLFSVLKKWIGLWGSMVWGIIVLLEMAVCYQLWKKLSPLVAMLWTLALTTIVTPYVWSWDFVLLLPVWVYTFAKVDWKRKTFLFVTYWIGWQAFSLVQHLEGSSNDMFWWVPLWYSGSVILATLWKPQQRDLTIPNNTPSESS